MALPRVLFLQPVLPRYRVPVFSALAGRGFEVTCWSDHLPGGSLKHVNPAGLFATQHRRERTLGPFFSQPALWEAAQSEQFDVVVWSWNVRYLELMPSLLLARARALPTVLWGHARGKHERAAVRRLRNQVGNLASACMTYDTAASEQLVRDGFAPSRVFTAQNALDETESVAAQAYWREHPAELLAFQTQHQLAGRPVALYVSRLEPEKRVDQLLLSFRQVIQHVPNALLCIVGAGSERDALGTRVQTLGLKEHVRFVGAVYEERALAAWFMSAQVFAFATQIGLSLLHAFSYGVPVVTSEQAGGYNPEFLALRDNVNGLTYRAGDSVHFAQQLVRCLTEPETQQRLAQQARQTVAAPGGYNLQTMLDGMEAALRFALANAYAASRH